MSEGNRPKVDASEPWNSATTEPLPMPLAQMRDEERRSPDSSGSMNAATTGPKKVAEVKRSAEVESLLEGLSYPRSHVTMQRSETDGALFAAHSSGPRAVPAGAQTPTLEPPLMLSQSLVEAISQPTPPVQPVAVKREGSDPAARAGRPPVLTTIVLARKTYRRLAIAFVPCVVIAVGIAWMIARSGGAPTKSPVIVDPAAVLAPEPAAAPPVPPVAPVATVAATPSVVAPAPSPAATPEPVASAAPPLAVSPLPPRVPRAAGGVVRPASGKSTHAAPPTSSTKDSSSLHTDFEVQN